MSKLKHEAYAAMDRALQMMSGALEVIAAENGKYDPAAVRPPAHTRRDFTGDDFVIEDLRESLSPAAKRFLCHHLKNTINSVNLYIEAGEYRAAQSVVWQLNDVIEQIMEVGHGHGAGVEAKKFAGVSEGSAGSVGG